MEAKLDKQIPTGLVGFTEARVKADNTHFVGDVTFVKVQPAEEEDNKDFGFTITLIVGCTGNKYRAAYNYHPENRQWGLGCN